jgi:formamidopyrimidine-DNA glycosylase
MPELPEVEHRLQYFKRVALGQRVLRVVVTAPNMIKSPATRRFASGLAGRRFLRASRRGKYLIVELDDSRSLILHFGMGGDLILYRYPSERPDYTRIEFILESGYRLAFTCPRKICRVMLVDHPESVPALGEMGPEPLGRSLSLAYLQGVLDRSPNRLIKPLLMDQRKIAGVGNIYADEILFEAGVHPERRASAISEAEVRLIHQATRRVLRRALSTAGEEEFPEGFLVSRSSSGGRCGRCGGEIRHKRVGGRTAYFCESCQR